MYLKAHLIPPPVLQLLTQLTQTGMFGASNEETAAILLKEKLREIQREEVRRQRSEVRSPTSDL